METNIDVPSFLSLQVIILRWMYVLKKRMVMEDDLKEHQLDTASAIVPGVGFKYLALGFMVNGSVFTILIAANMSHFSYTHD